MYRKIIYNLLFFIVALSVSKASTYLNEEAAQEGLRRGQSESFASSTGQFTVILNDGNGGNFNGVLIAPSLVITSRHALKNTTSSWKGRFCTYYDAKEYEDAFRTRTPDPLKDHFINFGSPLNSPNIFFHPDEKIDLAIVQLMRSLNIQPIPLLLNQPKIWSNGFFVSYAPVYTSPSSTEIFAKNKRHIAIFDVKESTLALQTSKGIETIPTLLKYWHLEGDIADPLNRKFIPNDEMHRLTALTQMSDSGAGFVVKYDGEYMVAGIHKGRSISHDERDVQKQVSSHIIPFYPYKDWIEKILKKVP